MTNGFELIDSAQRSKDRPESWSHPGPEALQALETGYFVRVGVTHPEFAGERFWAQIESISGPDIAVRIEQYLVNTREHGLRDKDHLIVQKKHVFGIADAKRTTLWEP